MQNQTQQIPNFIINGQLRNALISYLQKLSYEQVAFFVKSLMELPPITTPQPCECKEKK